MEKLIKPARIAYCIGLAGMVIPQLFYYQFGSNFFPAWPHLPLVAFWSYLFTVVVLAACIAILLQKHGRTAALALGTLLLATYCLGYIPYELLIAPYRDHLGTWGDGLKEPALAGGAFVVASTFQKSLTISKSGSINSLAKLIPFGPLLFCITMVLYGLSHCFYTQYISPLVPAWVPGGKTFWTLFAAVALMGSGLAITFNIKRKLAATLLGTMIFIWIFMIHIPSAIADPYSGHSNSIVSAFSALAFSAISFAIAGVADRKKV